MSASCTWTNVQFQKNWQASRLQRICCETFYSLREYWLSENIELVSLMFSVYRDTRFLCIMSTKLRNEGMILHVHENIWYEGVKNESSLNTVIAKCAKKNKNTFFGMFVQFRLACKSTILTKFDALLCALSTFEFLCFVLGDMKVDLLPKTATSVHYCRGPPLGQRFVATGRGRDPLQDEDHSGSRPHLFPGYFLMRSGWAPEWLRSTPVTTGSSESHRVVLVRLECGSLFYWTPLTVFL